MAESRADPDTGELTPRQIVTAMSGLVLAMLLAQLDNMIVAPALPTIVGELGGLNHLSWVVTALHPGLHGGHADLGQARRHLSATSTRSCLDRAVPDRFGAVRAART